MKLLHEDRLFPPDAGMREIAKRLYGQVRDLPILSPHGHTQASWFARNEAFPDPATLLIQPDHYVHRMLYSQGIPLENLEIGVPQMRDPRRVWRIFAEHYYLFRGTPTRLWLDYAFEQLFGMEQRLDGATADLYFDTISERLQLPEFRPRALFERFRIEVLATTDSALDSLADHEAIRQSGWKARIVPTFRPDAVVDPDFRRTSSGWASRRARTPRRGRGTWRLCGAPGSGSSVWAPRRPTMATRRPRRRT